MSVALRRLHGSLLGWAGALAWLCTLSCSSADSTRAVREEPPEEVKISTGINDCPSFQFALILPQAIRTDEVATVAAFATDRETGDTSIRYRWSATSGLFDSPDDPLSQYTCADPGPQLLTVTAWDPDGCEKHQDFGVDCGVQ